MVLQNGNSYSEGSENDVYDDDDDSDGEDDDTNGICSGESKTVPLHQAAIETLRQVAQCQFF